MNKKRNDLLLNAFSIKKLLKANAKQQYHRRKTKETTEIPQTKLWKDIKVTDLGMLVTTIVLTWGTLKLYHEAVNQSEISKKSAEAAITSDSLTQIVIGRDSARFAQSTNADSTKFAKQYELANSSLKTQIRAFEVSKDAANSASAVYAETKKEFTVLNEPYLQFDFKGIDSPKVGRHLTGYFDIKNLGKYPVQIIEAKISSGIKLNDPVFASVYNQMGVTEETNDEYVTEGRPLLNIYSSDIFPLTETEFNELNNPRYFYYLIGYCKYKNLITKEYKVYEVIIKYSYVLKQFWYKRNINHVDSVGK